jgi:[ribosomal protein S5]-alanine N-acetyltransferase
MTKTANDTGYPQRYAYAVSRHIYFRYLTEEDAIGDWHLWFNSPEVTENLIGQSWYNTPESQLQYLDYLRNSKDRLALAIIDRETEKHIGIASLSKVDMLNRKAESAIVIGPTEFRDGSHALEALALITEIGLVRLNLNKIYATGMETHERGLSLNRLLGWTESGRFREHGFVNGKYLDAVILEIFQRDWLVSPRRPKSIQWHDDD